MEPMKEKIDGREYFFDSPNCITIFKKLANMYGHDFKTLSANEQYVYSPKWESIVPKEQEFGKMKSKIETIEYETFQVIRDPIQVQELVFKLARSSENEILGLFSTSNAFRRQERMDMIPKLKLRRSYHRF